MANLRRSIPSMSALATFEAAARLASFTLAAAELGVTQAAVSRQIKLLEEDLNTRLFLRAHRRVELTASGKALGACVSQAFTSMADMIQTLRQPEDDQTVTLGASLAFGHFWILPRLSGFRAAHPEIKLKLVADDSVTDLRRDRLDVAFRFGKAPFPDAQSVISLSDRVFAVCSPRLLQAHHTTAAEADLLDFPLIASDTVNPTWLTWRSWAEGVGLAESAEIGRASDLSRLRFTHYTDTIQAAINGEGVAMGWEALLSGPLREGRLLRLGPATLRLEACYHLLLPAGRTPSAAARVFVDWISGHIAREGLGAP